MSVSARRQALWRHTNAICVALMRAGSIDWLPSCFALALKSMGHLEELMSTRVLADLKLEVVRDLARVLKAE